MRDDQWRVQHGGTEQISLAPMHIAIAMEYHGCVLVKRTERSAGLPAGCHAGVLARIHFGTIPKSDFTVVAPLSRPASIASGGWEAGATICTTAPPLVGFQA
jgi:hypothetical protein